MQTYKNHRHLFDLSCCKFETLNCCDCSVNTKIPINRISFSADQRTKRIQKMNDLVLTDGVGTFKNLF